MESKSIKPKFEIGQMCWCVPLYDFTDKIKRNGEAVIITGRQYFSGHLLLNSGRKTKYTGVVYGINQSESENPINGTSLTGRWVTEKQLSLYPTFESVKWSECEWQPAHLQRQNNE